MKKIILFAQVFTMIAALPLYAYMELTHGTAVQKSSSSTIAESPVIKNPPAATSLVENKRIINNRAVKTNTAVIVKTVKPVSSCCKTFTASKCFVKEMGELSKYCTQEEIEQFTEELETEINTMIQTRIQKNKSPK